jgi:hypothetical protein
MLSPRQSPFARAKHYVLSGTLPRAFCYELPARGVVVRLLDQGLWRLLFRSGKLTKEERKSLGEMHPYLGGNVTKAEFNEGSFITAARFLLQMRLLTILRNLKATRRVITRFGV